MFECNVTCKCNVTCECNVTCKCNVTCHVRLNQIYCTILHTVGLTAIFGVKLFCRHQDCNATIPLYNIVLCALSRKAEVQYYIKRRENHKTLSRAGCFVFVIVLLNKVHSNFYLQVTNNILHDHCLYNKTYGKTLFLFKSSQIK